MRQHAAIQAASPVVCKKSAAQNLGGTSGQFLDFL